MHIKKGEVYLANLGDVKCADIGKTRPVLIFQTENLNRMVEDGLYDDVIVIPLSSQIKKSDFTYVIRRRDLLQKDSTLLCNAIKMVKASRLLKEHGVLTRLTEEEIKLVEKKVLLLLDIK